jgi:hypothetical protein
LRCWKRCGAKEAAGRNLESSRERDERDQAEVHLSTLSPLKLARLHVGTFGELCLGQSTPPANRAKVRGNTPQNIRSAFPRHIKRA